MGDRARSMEGTAEKRRICQTEGTAGDPSCAHSSTEGDEKADSLGHDYEVFLSFRGPDTRATFTSFLYTSLNDAGIYTFKDDEDLRKGEEFAPQLKQAITKSKIFIPILSKNYASSRWCLKEIAQMVECKKHGGQEIMPIFYDVAPAEVRHQTKDYKNAFLSHESKKRYDQKTITEWKEALTAVAGIHGWDLQSMPNRQEGEFVKRFTQEVFNKLKKASLVVSDYLVGVEHHVDAIMEMIGAWTSETRIIGIHGMGGIGKTTIAKIIYNQLSKNIDHCCFLSNIRETSETKGIEYLQNQLISDVLKKEWTSIRNYHEGTRNIKATLSAKKVVILVDDVDHKNHMDALVGEREWFGRGSKLIITTRKKDVLNVPQVDNLYEVTFMDPDQSLQLFSKHAFRTDYPLAGYINQSKRAIKIAEGLPLALEVIGSLLSHTEKEKWDAKLKRLEDIPPKDVQSKLKISYDALETHEKYIFLDIACFFSGYSKVVLTYFWKSNLHPEDAMNVLENMSLIKITDDNNVRMHDQLRDLGKEIIREKSGRIIEKQSRVWDPEEAADLLLRCEDKNDVEALCLKFDHDGQYRFTYQGFRRLSNVSYLAIDGSKENFDAEERLLLHESQSNVLPTYENSDLLPRLRWLSWCDLPPTFQISNFSMKQVVILDLSRSEITHDWEGWSHMKVMKNLKVLNLTGCQRLVRTPTFSAPANIERLILQDCKSLIKIDESICQLKSLVYFDASDCKNLRELPNELGGDLASLKYLYLRRCIWLERLPDSIWDLESLIELDIRWTRIKELPNSIRRLKNLKAVKTWGSYIIKIPDALWTMEELEEIEYYCKKYPEGKVEVGNQISANQSLRILRLKLANIYALPRRLPESLTKLELSCLCMEKFPDLSNLTHLKKLNLMFGAPDLEVKSNGPEEYEIPKWIEKLSKLESLRLHSYYVTASPPDLSLPSQLKELRLNCSNLRCLPRIPSSLSSLYLQHCNSLCSVEFLSNMKNLSSLCIDHTAIAEIEGLGCLQNLRDLVLRWLGRVKMLPDLSNLNKLKFLLVYACDDLVEMQGEVPRSLAILRIYDCRSLQKLPDLSSLMGRTSLMGKTEVDITGCNRLCDHACINYLILDIVGFKQLRVIPDLGNSNKLRHLQLERCSSLVEIQGKLPTSLKKLKISSCESLQKLPDLSSLKGLEQIDIEGCTKLKGEAILGFARKHHANLWESLQCLRICRLEQLVILPDLNNLNKLRSLQVEDCRNLVDIQGRLPQSLEELKIESCKSLQRLPDLPSLNGLRKVKINSCYNIDVEAISRRCSERVIFVEEDMNESEYGGEEDVSESEYGGEEDVSEFEYAEEEDE